MKATPRITILPAPRCRRSKKVLAFLQAHAIPFEQIGIDSPDGQRLQQQHQFRASPGILIDGEPLNPYEILLKPQCRMDKEKALQLFTGSRTLPPGNTQV